MVEFIRPCDKYSHKSNFGHWYLVPSPSLLPYCCGEIDYQKMLHESFPSVCGVMIRTWGKTWIGGHE